MRGHKKEMKRVLANNRGIKDVITRVNSQSEEIQMEIDEV